MTDVLDEIAARTEDRTGRDIALAIGALVGDGILQPGDRLPTVRANASKAVSSRRQYRHSY